MRTLRTLLLAAIAAGCTPADADQDGWTTAQGDCDDSDPDVHPGAAERCGGGDEDCDDLVDDDDPDLTDPLAWHQDADGDGFGDPDQAVARCNQPSGTVADATDCDDARSDVHPGADESDCTDPGDRDCDGVSAWTDADGDGWASCEDCDDGSRFVHPGAVDRCNDVDDDCDGEVDEDESESEHYPDGDGDGYGDGSAEAVIQCDPPAGYAADGSDCDDTNADAHPGQDERCNEIDDDCDGEVDEADAVDARPWYVDADGDGHGAPGVGEPACSAPTGYSIDDYDCDDDDDAVSPSATETCGDGIDQDCNGADRSATTHYADVDGDGYGDPRSTKALCYPGGGYVTDKTDCDDEDDTVSPVGTEVCDERDNDCDGTVDEGVTTTFYDDQDGDGYGVDDREEYACSLPYGHATVGGDCDDGDPEVNPATAEVDDDGVDNDCDGSADSIALSGISILGAAAYDSIGLGPAAAGDIDGDGWGDIWVDAPGDDRGGSAAGAALLFFGPLSGTTDAGAADAVLQGEASGDQAGRVIASADLDLDGVQDVAVGAFRSDRGGTNAGAAYVVYGAVSGTMDLGDADAILVGETASGWAAYHLAVPGDVDGDGWPDLLVGEPYFGGGAGAEGAAHLFLGPVSGTRTLDEADARWSTADANDRAGSHVGGMDADGDGLADLVIAAPDASGTGTAQGAVYLLTDALGGTGDLADADVIFTGSADASDFGQGIAAGGDVDGDGHEDLVVGAPQETVDGGANTGTVYLWRGPIDEGGVASTSADLLLIARTAGNQLGATVAFPGDVDGDGRTELLVGSIDEDTVGAAYLYRDLPDGSAYARSLGYRIAGSSAGEDLGRGATGAGDLDGDGLDDFLLGDPLDDEGASDAGKLYLFLSSEVGW
jgi:hypothetical protein